MTTNKQKTNTGFTRQNFPRKNLGGFTLLETMIAITILLIAVVGPISLIGNSVHNLYYARNQMSAINLAQEGIEVVRQIRDSNKLSGRTVWTSLVDGNYYVDASAFAGNMGTGGWGLSPCVTCTLQPVFYDTATGLYRQGIAGGTATPFQRIVTITTVTATEKKITSTVSWTTGGQNGSLSVSENLFEWAP